MQTRKSGALVAMIGAAALVGLTAAPAIASPGITATGITATATNGSETVTVSNPFVLQQSSPAAGTAKADPPNSNTICPDGGQFSTEANPSSCEGPGIPAANQGVITGSGFTPGANVYVGLCNGVPSTTNGYEVAANCTYDNTATIVPASGNIAINTAQGSYQFEVFHGEDLNDEDWNCLAKGDDPNGTTTAVGNLPIDNTLPSYGASTVGAAGGSTAPCQLRIGITQTYTAQDIYIPVTNLDGALTPPVTAPESPLTVALPVAAGVIVLGGGAFVARRRRRSAVAV
jgi:hypothetical protein